METIESDDDDTLLDSIDLDMAAEDLLKLSSASNDAGFSPNRDDRQFYRRQMDARRRLEQLREEKELAARYDDWGD